MLVPTKELAKQAYRNIKVHFICMLSTSGSISMILGINLIFLCFKLITIPYHTPKQRKIKFKPTEMGPFLQQQFLSLSITNYQKNWIESHLVFLSLQTEKKKTTVQDVQDACTCRYN